MREAMVDEAAAMHGMPRQYLGAATFPQGQGLAQEQQGTAEAFHQAWAAQGAGSMAQQQAQNLAVQLHQCHRVQVAPSEHGPLQC